MGDEGGSWIGDSDVLTLFPTLVWKLQLKPGAVEQINQNILDALGELRQGLPILKAGEGWQSDPELQKLEKFNGLAACIDEAVRRILRFLRIGYDNFEITGCWANIGAAGASHRIHNHPNNFLSGVYYVQTHAGANSINFHDPRPQTGIIRPPVTALTGQNTDQVVVEVTNGSLLIFPSYLQHSVDPNRGTEERVSISFNVMFSGFAENLSKPLW
jgi:uncharacterized protein (TIGR02466 family)